MLDRAKRLLLISNSTLFGGGYLDHAEQAIVDFLGPSRCVLFVPFALFDRDAYARQAESRFAAMGYRLTSIHRAADFGRALEGADAVFIGGGNTFRLLQALQEHDLLGAIRGRVEAGMPYVGWSAGSVVACPTIRTTNDMPVVAPRRLDALWLVGFQINAHFTDAHPPNFQGETRRQRLAEFVAANPDVPVIGLPEGSMLRVEGDAVSLLGPHAAPVFGVPGVEEVSPGEVPPGVLERAPGGPGL